MRDIALFVHILGWAQWMGAQLALAGLLRKPDLFAPDVGPVVARQLTLLWITLFVGGLVTVFGGIWLLKVNPAYARMGFVLTKMLLLLVGFFIAVIPLRGAHQRLEDGGKPASALPLFGSLAVFITSIYLGVFKPY